MSPPLERQKESAIATAVAPEMRGGSGPDRFLRGVGKRARQRDATLMLQHQVFSIDPSLLAEPAAQEDAPCVKPTHVHGTKAFKLLSVARSRRC